MPWKLSPSNVGQEAGSQNVPVVVPEIVISAACATCWFRAKTATSAQHIISDFGDLIILMALLPPGSTKAFLE
jgi:hypothetical protein